MQSTIYKTPAWGEYNPTYFNSTGDMAPVQISWASVAGLIRDDATIKKETFKARAALAEGNAAAYKSVKSRMPAITPAATCFGGHRQEHVAGLTGVSLVDLDHIEPERLGAVRDLVAKDPHTFLCHTTCSGEGLRVLFRYSCAEPQMAYLDAWKVGNEYYSLLTAHESDQGVNDVSRLSFLCHDAEVLFNPAATPFAVTDTATQGGGRVRRLSFGTSPFPKDCGDPLEKARYILERNGSVYAEGNRHNYCLSLAWLLNKMGVPEAELAATLAEWAPDGEREARAIAEHTARKYAAQFATWRKYGIAAERSESGGPRRLEKLETIEPLERPEPQEARSMQPSAVFTRDWLVEHSRMRFNTISGNIEVYSEKEERWAELEERFQNQLWYDCSQAFGKDIKPQVLNDIIHSEEVPPFNPFADYVEQLPEWDGHDHIGDLAARVHTTSDPALFDRCFRKWFVAILPALLERQVTNQAVMIFVGRQGLFKSTFFRRLLPPALDRYFLAKTNQARMSKDDKLSLCEYALICLEELDSMNDKDLNQIKALITTEVISERAAYARVKENRRHIASFCATGNNKQFLTDTTGNRRWLPFEVERIDSPYDLPLPYEQLYAQAVALWRGGFEYWFTKEEADALEEHQRQFMVPSPEEEQILRYYRRPRRLECGLPEQATYLTATEILACINADLRSALSLRMVGCTLKKLGFEQRCIGKQYKYAVVPRDVEELAAVRRGLEM